MIGIIDYGLGNIGSISNMFKKIKVSSKVIHSNDSMEGITKLVLPGVGAFDDGMNQLKKQGWILKLNTFVLEKKTPILGICLGMQLMGRSSKEGIQKGLGWINGDALKFNINNKNAKIPHMGWNEVRASTTFENSLFAHLMDEARFYHVHSYHMKLDDNKGEIARCNYFIEFTTAFKSGNIFGVQFHPEKSHKYGMQLFTNFANI